MSNTLGMHRAGLGLTWLGVCQGNFWNDELLLLAAPKLQSRTLKRCWILVPLVEVEGHLLVCCDNPLQCTPQLTPACIIEGHQSPPILEMTMPVRTLGLHIYISVYAGPKGCPLIYLVALAAPFLAMTFLAMASTLMQAACMDSLAQGLLLNLLLEGLHKIRHQHHAD